MFCAMLSNMRKTYKYRLFPTRRQVSVFNIQIEECRWLWNRLLGERKTAWEDRKESLSLYSQHLRLPRLKAERPGLTLVHSQVLQNVCLRLDLAFKAFFRRVKAGENPGYPRFRGAGWYDSMTFPQAPSGCCIKNGRLAVSKVGHIKTKIHRPPEGRPKTCTIRRTSTSKWYVTFSCEIETPAPLPVSGKQVGIDVGLATFAHLSTGETVDNPRFFRTDEYALAKAQRRLSKSAKGTPERTKRRKPVSRIHERIGWRRNNFAHQEARKIVDRFDVIAVEDLSVNRMIHNRCLSKSISDAAWGLFLGLIVGKAESAGRQVVQVNPAYTSQDCSGCGHRQALKLSNRLYRCPCCGLELNRDHNASLNILAVGLHSLGLAPRSPRIHAGE